MIQLQMSLNPLYGVTMNRICIIACLFIISILVGCKSGETEYTKKCFDVETAMEISEEQPINSKYYESYFDSNDDK